MSYLNSKMDTSSGNLLVVFIKYQLKELYQILLPVESYALGPACPLQSSSDVQSGQIREAALFTDGHFKRFITYSHMN